MSKHKNNRNLNKAVDKILWEDWDPIGINDNPPDDEYRTYVPKIVELLKNGCDSYKLSKHLNNLTKVAMGVGENDIENKRIASLLIETKNTMQKKKHPAIKSKLHPRSKHRQRYDFEQLIASCPALKQYVAVNKYGDESINFFDAAAVKMLNTALLKHYYNLEYWDVPTGYLCPPIPGRADYIHHIADLLAKSNKGKIPRGAQIKCFDIGAGANCVYPIIGNKEYAWSFIGSETDPIAMESANKIIDKNPILKGKVEMRLQANRRHIFHGIIKKGEQIDLAICNPPFHGSLEEAQAGTRRKLRNLKQKRTKKPALNFGGQNHELWCEGGEERFVKNMIRESQDYATSCAWFSTLIAKSEHLPSIYRALEKANTMGIKTIPMGQGNKVSRIVAWTFLSSKQQNVWAETRW